MATGGKIKWSKNDARKVANLVRQFNAKITRITRKNPSIAKALPERMNSQAIQQMYSQLTRKDFNRWVASTMRFLRKGAEDVITTKAGVTTTRWQLNEIRYNLNAINADRRKRMERLQPSTLRGTMGAIQELELTPRRNLSQTIPREYWEKYVSGIEKQVLSSYIGGKMVLYKENYKKAILNELGNQEELLELVDSIPTSTLAEAYAYDPDLQIRYIYYDIDIEDKVANLMEKLGGLLE